MRYAARRAARLERTSLSSGLFTKSTTLKNQPRLRNRVCAKPLSAEACRSEPLAGQSADELYVSPGLLFIEGELCISHIALNPTSFRSSKNCT